MGSPWHRLLYIPLLDRFIYYSLFSCVKINYFHCHCHIVGNFKKSQLTTPNCWSMISSLLHLVGLQPRVYYTLTNFRGASPPCPPPPQYANGLPLIPLVRCDFSFFPRLCAKRLHYSKVAAWGALIYL